MSKRSQFATKTGVIAATVGSAVGLGNIWRFPYEAGTHGGGAFLLIYIICVFAIGIPVMLAEFTIGRSTHSNALGAFRKLLPGTPFRGVAYIGIISGLMILSFYSVVAGWIMEYLYQSVTELFRHTSQHQYAQEFQQFQTNPWRPALWTLIFLGINFMVIRRGIEKGIEKLSNILMPLLFLILIGFCINSLTMDKAAQGLNFLFNPDFSKISPSMVIGAMGQAFFSLSLGLTCLLTYSSYFSDGTPLIKSATITALLDTLVAILAGVLIFPAVFTFGMEPADGPTLVFMTLPEIFAKMPGGHIWSVAFFALLFFASITSTVSMSEIAIPYFVEEKSMSRSKATAVTIGIVSVFGVLCALSFGILADFKIFGMTIFNLFDYVTANILLPCGGFLMSIFVGWWLDRKVLATQLSNHGRIPATLVSAIRFCIRWIAPVAILIIFIYNLV